MPDFSGNEVTTTTVSSEPPVDRKSAQSRYMMMEAKRLIYLNRARRMALLTIPSLYPPEGWTAASEFEDPYQSVGSQGVSNLSSKLLLALLPPNMAFFRYEPVSSIQAQLNTNPQMKQAVEEALADYETETLRELERAHIRSACFNAFKHLVVAGNVLLYIPNKGTVRFFTLTSYVCRRDPRGAPVEIYIKECVAPETLDPDVRDFIMGLQPHEQKQDPSCEKIVEIYTGVVLQGDKWVTWQEVFGKFIPGTRGSFPKDDTRYLPLRFTRMDGEDYGRSYCEELAGDLRVCDALAQTVAEGSLIAAKVLFGIKPNATVTSKDLENKPNGGFFEGMPEDVWALQVNKSSDFSVAANKEQELRRSLSAAFLMNSSVQRDAERVTGEEIKYVAQELENALGGLYSLLSEEFQRPLVNRMMKRLAATNKMFPELGKNLVTPVIVTGIDALGRNHELQALESAISVTTQLLGPQVAAQYLQPDLVMKAIFTASGVKTNFIKTPEQIQQDQQQAQQQQMLQQATPHLAKAAGDVLSAHAMPQQGQQQQQPQVPGKGA